MVSRVKTVSFWSKNSFTIFLVMFLTPFASTPTLELLSKLWPANQILPNDVEDLVRVFVGRARRTRWIRLLRCDETSSLFKLERVLDPEVLLF